MNSSTASVETRRGGDESVTEPPEVRETHTGMVVLVGDRAYKCKKPIVTDFLDFSTVQRREEVCQREVRLNGRMASDSYFGVAHLTDPQGGDPEPIVVMRRYSDRCRLASMVRRGEPVEGHLSAIAQRLARFHAEGDRSRTIDVAAKVPAITARWEENLSELRHHVGTALDADVLDEVARLATDYIDGRAALFAARIVEQRIVDGHGDLIADDVFCMPDGPVLLDCLEFDDQLRYVDGIDDAAFLAMDLEFLGHRDLGALFLEEYRRVSRDQAPASLAHFYIAYRAVVRAKVDCIRSGQGVPGAVDDARRHVDLAVQHLRAGTVRLILVGGGPGTGKTTLARALGRTLTALLISSDDVRREMQVEGDIDGEPGTLNSGLYSADNVDAVYATMLRRARLELVGGRSVILDGTWRDPQHREWARELAHQEHCPTVELACTLPLGDAMARIASRPKTTSDATPQIASAITLDEWDWREARHIDTSRPLGDSVAEAHELCCLTF